MKLEITTTPKAVERVNMVLKFALDEISAKPNLRKLFDCDDKTLKQMESFRKSMLKSFIA